MLLLVTSHHCETVVFLLLLCSKCRVKRFKTWLLLSKRFSSFFSFFVLIYLFIFGCVGSSLLCAGLLQLQRAGLLFVAVHRPLIVVASLVVEHRL